MAHIARVHCSFVQVVPQRYPHGRRRSVVPESYSSTMATSRATRQVVHLMHGDVLLQPNLRLPMLEHDELATLSQFVQAVWTDTPEWSQFLDSELGLRALPTYSIHGDICFELRNSRHSGVVRRFLYERVRGLLIVERSHLVEDDSEVDCGKSKVPFAESALRIIAAYEQGPADPDPDRRVEFQASFSLDRIPKYTGISDLAHRFVDHWFAPVDKNWKWYSRFPFTLAGSTTFFVFWVVYVLVVAKAVDYLEFNFVPAIILGLSVVGPLWFSVITTWADMRHGPIRLFLSGFLLPYFIWTLVTFMYEQEVPTFLAVHESTLDNSPAPRPVLPAPEELITPQSPGQP